MNRTAERYITLDTGESDATAESMRDIAAGLGGITFRLIQLHSLGAIGVADPVAMEALMMAVDAADRIEPARSKAAGTT